MACRQGCRSFEVPKVARGGGGSRPKKVHLMFTLLHWMCDASLCLTSIASLVCSWTCLPFIVIKIHHIQIGAIDDIRKEKIKKARIKIIREKLMRRCIFHAFLLDLFYHLNQWIFPNDHSIVLIIWEFADLFSIKLAFMVGATHSLFFMEITWTLRMGITLETWLIITSKRILNCTSVKNTAHKVESDMIRAHVS
jgi:hypothetical protein